MLPRTRPVADRRDAQTLGSGNDEGSTARLGDLAFIFHHFPKRDVKACCTISPETYQPSRPCGWRSYLHAAIVATLMKLCIFHFTRWHANIPFALLAGHCRREHTGGPAANRQLLGVAS